VSPDVLEADEAAPATTGALRLVEVV
jgi:hypothetical protein